jgi:holo-[acyl-carrier protein] synthase
VSATTPTCRVGVDLVAVEDVAASVEQFGERYLARVYTDHERASCAGDPATLAAGLAARFAAKEAALKVLRPAGARPEWRSIEVVRQPSGACDVVLTGEAARLAAAAGVAHLAVSLTHEAGMAAAVVVAMCAPAPAPVHPTDGSTEQGE